ncbi:uncharacterized protein LOC129942936 isoform X2 [Eupeodes corollae]|uniref:uncharacterized protein LOC129942936 isoform X2 n=1 Tax=Eupeodes corollae TaxID=290404 RepID=UPI00248F4F6D|nr:uncharacterized protein LOC129942936 isoform X2 [Eupeodes corollae]
MESSIEKGIKVYTTTENDNPEISNEDYNTLFVYLCAFCDEQFHSNKFLVKHMSNEHFVEAENKELNNSIQYSEDESESYILEELKKQTSDELYSIETLSNKDFDLEHQVEADTEGFESDAWGLNEQEQKVSFDCGVMHVYMYFCLQNEMFEMTDIASYARNSKKKCIVY